MYKSDGLTDIGGYGSIFNRNMNGRYIKEDTEMKAAVT